MSESYVQVYTGNGKGKTTASIGLAVRAAMADKKVFIGQFIKGMNYSELKIPQFIPNIEIKQFGSDRFIINEPSENDLKIAMEGLEVCRKALNSDYDLVILEEINIAIFFNIFTPKQIIDMIKERNPKTEVVLTGRNATPEIIEFADLVTEMKEIKHYYNIGVQARKGIEF